MLHRAASNAYSWWWASHIRTKQSKWLEQNLQDVEEKVKYMLKLIEEDGDSFAKRAEMYYRKRPELINFVEESYRAYRALAERYDHISGELQNANNTLATVFPEQVQFSIDEEEDNYSARLPSHSMHPSKFPKELPQVPKSDPPKFPGTPKKGKEGSPRKFLRKTQSKKTRSIKATNPQMTEAEALDEIDKLQKGILGMQTEKEFVKSSYESRISKYWEIEKEIAEMQERVWSLQEEFCVGTVIEDNDARNLMASTALRSCEETLSQLQEKQGRSIEEAKLERRRLKDSHEKLEALKDELLHNQTEENAHKKEITDAEHPSLDFLDEEVIRLQQVRLESESIREKIREHFEMNCNRSFTVTEVVEKIEELVTKVIILENAVLSQTALLQRLRSQTNEIQEHLRSLEEDKTTLSSEKLKQLEEELQAVQDLNRNIENQNNNLETHFTEAHCNLDHLSEKLKSAKETDEVIEVTRSKLPEDASRLHVQPYKEYKEVQADVQNPFDKSDTETRFTSKAEENEEEAISPLTDQDDLFDLRPMSSDNLEDLATEIVKPQEDGVMKEDESSQANDNRHQDQVKKEEEFSLAKGNEEQDQAKEEQESSLAKENKQQDQVKEEQGSSQAMDNEQKGRVKEEQDSSLAKDNEQKGPVKEEQESSQATDSEEEEDSGQETEPNWRELFLNSLDGREKILLQEYTSILRNYKEVKKKLTEAEKKNRDGLINTMVQLKELKSSNAVKDVEIRSLRKNLMFLQATYSESSLRPETGDSQVGRLDDKTAQSSSCQPEVTERMDESTTGEVASTPLKEDLKVIPEPHVVSPIEEKFRTDIDDLLEENLEFWLRFSTAFHHIEKFQTQVHDLKADYLKLKDNKKQEGSTTSKHHSQKSDARAIYKHLREIQTELQVWLEQNMLLKDELKDRISSLCDMQEEIKKVLECGTGTDEEAEFTSYQAAKFQGEILNMKQENNKVADELQAGLDHVNELQLEIESTLARLDDKWKLSGSKNHHNVIQSLSRTRIPLRSLLFGVKAKKKPSLFSCISPALQKQYSDLQNNAPI